MSIGCAIYPQDAVDQSGLLSCADMALHDLKARGRGGIRMYDPCMMQMTETVASQQFSSSADSPSYHPTLLST